MKDGTSVWTMIAAIYLNTFPYERALLHYAQLLCFFATLKRLTGSCFSHIHFARVDTPEPLRATRPVGSVQTNHIVLPNSFSNNTSEMHKLSQPQLPKYPDDWFQSVICTIWATASPHKVKSRILVPSIHISSPTVI